MRFVAAILFLFSLVETGLARPARVILLRHAEKPQNPADTHLSDQGRLRAEALAFCLTTNTVLLADGLPVALFATKFAHSSDSQRPFETLQPLATKLNLAIQTPYARRNHAELVKSILNNLDYENKTIVICWVHDFLPDLARELGVKKVPAEWRSDVYDRFWVVTWARKSARMSSLPQHIALNGPAK